MAVKIWTSAEKNDDKVIALLNDGIYKANPPVTEIDAYVLGIKTNNLSSKKSFEIPLHYISAINLQEGQNYIKVIFKGDYELLKVNDEKTRNEIFEFFKQNISGVSYHKVRLTKFQTAKKPLIAIVVLTAIFIWSLFIAIGIEDGNEYDVTDQHYHSVAGIILVLASIGVKNLILLFGGLFLIAFTSFIKKFRNPVVTDTLLIKH
jgi:hypothetical protein